MSMFFSVAYCTGETFYLDKYKFQTTKWKKSSWNFVKNQLRKFINPAGKIYYSCWFLFYFCFEYFIFMLKKTKHVTVL